jgi:hypothetical protein
MILCIALGAGRKLTVCKNEEGDDVKAIAGNILDMFETAEC